MSSFSARSSELCWPEPGVTLMSTSRPSSRKKPSSRATSKGRSCTALIIEALTFFSSGMAVPSLKCLLFSAQWRGGAFSWIFRRLSIDALWRQIRNREQLFDREFPQHHLLVHDKLRDRLERLPIRLDAERK